MSTSSQGRAYKAHPWRPVRHVAAAHVLSVGGNVILTVAIPWLVLTITGSAAQAGLAVFAGVIGASVGGVAASRVVGRIGAVRTSAVADVLSGLAVVPLPVLLALDALEVRYIVLLAVLGTLGDSAGWTARQAVVPAAADASGVSREQANALFTSAEHVAYLLGAPAGGLLINVVGVGGALWVTVTAFGLAAVVVTALGEVHPRPDPAFAESGPGLRDAVAFIWGDPVLRSLVVFPTASVLVVGPLVQLVLPVLARETFGDPVALGLMVASFGIGGLAGATTYGVVGARTPRRTLYRGIFVVWPAAYVAITVSPALPVTLAALLVLGTAAGALVPLQATVRQERAPDHLLASVVALSTVLLPVAIPIGVLVTGVLVDAIGLHSTMLMLSAVALTIGGAVLSSPVVSLLDDTASETSCAEPAGSR